MAPSEKSPQGVEQEPEFWAAEPLRFADDPPTIHTDPDCKHLKRSHNIHPVYPEQDWDFDICKTCSGNASPQPGPDKSCYRALAEANNG